MIIWENSSTRRLHHVVVYVSRVLMHLVKSAVFCIALKKKPMVLCFSSLWRTVPKHQTCFSGLHNSSLFSVKSVFDSLTTLFFFFFFFFSPRFHFPNTQSEQNLWDTPVSLCFTSAFLGPDTYLYLTLLSGAIASDALFMMKLVTSLLHWILSTHLDLSILNVYALKKLPQDTTATKQCCLEKGMLACGQTAFQSHFKCEHARNVNICIDLREKKKIIPRGSTYT